MKSYTYEGQVNVIALRLSNGGRLKTKLVPKKVIDLPEDHKIVQLLVKRGTLKEVAGEDVAKLKAELGVIEPTVLGKGATRPGQRDARKADGKGGRREGGRGANEKGDGSKASGDGSNKS